MNRTEYVGASEVAALMGLHPFKNALSVYEEKVGESTDKPSRNKNLGTRLEPGLIEHFRIDYLKNAVLQETSVQLHLRHPTLPMGATLDSMVLMGSYKRRKFKAAPLEIKVIGMSGKLPYHDLYGKGGSDQVPPHVMYQVQQQLHLCKTSGLMNEDDNDGFIGLLDIQGKGDVLYRIAYEPWIGQMLEKIIGTFWDRHVKTRIPPEPNANFLAESLF